MSEKPGFTFAMFGSSSQQRAFLDAFEGFEAEWEHQGYESLSSSDAKDRLEGRDFYPKEWHVEGVVNNFFLPPHFIQLLLSLKEPATTAAIEVALGGILHSAFHRFRKMLEPQKDGKSIQLPMKLCPSVWFEQDQVLVTIVADIQSREDFRIAEALISQGFERAAQWLARNRRTHSYMTYRIHEGVLDAKPILSDVPFGDLTK